MKLTVDFASVSRGFGYISTASGIAIAISCNYVLLIILGMDTQNSLRVEGQFIAIFEIALAAILMLTIMGPILELASLYPGSPSLRTYTKKHLGSQLSLLLTVGYLVVLITIAGIESFLLYAILTSYFSEALSWGVVFSVLGFVIVINYRGLRVSENLQRISTTLLWFGSLLLCWFAYNQSEVEPFAHSMNTFNEIKNIVPSAIVFGIFLFIGVELAASSVRKPEDFFSLLPKSMYIAILSISLLYMSMAFVFLELKPHSVPAENPLLYFAQLLFSHEGRLVALFLTIQALVTSFNSGLSGASRMIYMLAREGVLTNRLLKLGRDGITPVNAVLLMSSLSILLSFVTIGFGLSTEFSQLSASLICLIYSGLLIASCLTASRQQQVGHFYKSQVPRGMRLGLAILFAILSCINLSELLSSLGGAVICLIVCVTLFLIWFQSKPNTHVIKQAR
ncbi:MULTISPECIES: APC family permease [unclassified Pseudoalteromonas]|uniref:APC family permease n=1 Tax=unclassified Pseudoalteromonas TaxID=194690 RepID=UPI00301455B8